MAIFIWAIVSLVCVLSSPCYALTVSGLPEWLGLAARRSLSAVWDEIPDAPDVDREATLQLVADRLFTGYDVRVSPGAEGPVVRFVPQGETHWSVVLTPPDLRGMAESWFRSDARGLEEEAAALLRPLPEAALTWADVALEEALSQAVERRLPGWDTAMQIALDGPTGTLKLSFRPTMPLVLAISPSLSSRTVPAMFRSDLEARLVPALSPLIGLPVAWVERHREEVEAEARAFLEDRRSVGNMRAKVDVMFAPGPVSSLDARVDSDRFLFQVWVAAYAGLDGRYPEAGIFFGWDTEHVTGVDLELYAELIVSLDDFGVVHRLGARVPLWQDLWAGAEVQWPEGDWAARVWWGGIRPQRPYLWWRWGPDLGHEGALGYRVDEHVSIELYYDGTGEDKLGLRGLWSL